MPWLRELDDQTNWRKNHPVLASLSHRHPRLGPYLGEPTTSILRSDSTLQTLAHDLSRLQVLGKDRLGHDVNETAISLPSIAENPGQVFVGLLRQSFRLAGFTVLMVDDGLAVQHAALSMLNITSPTLGV